MKEKLAAGCSMLLGVVSADLNDRWHGGQPPNRYMVSFVNRCTPEF